MTEEKQSTILFGSESEERTPSPAKSGPYIRTTSMDDPDYDFYRDSGSYKVLVYAFLMQLLGMSTYIMYILFSTPKIVPLLQLLEPSPIGPYTPLYLSILLMCTLNTLVIGQHETRHKTKRVFVMTLWFLTCIGIYVPAIVVPLGANTLALWLTLATHGAVYTGLTILDIQSDGSPLSHSSSARKYSDDQSLLAASVMTGSSASSSPTFV